MGGGRPCFVHSRQGEVEAAESAVSPSGCGLDHQIKSVSLDVEDLYLLRVVMDLLTQQRDDIQQGWSS